jgi:membrane-anchored protein YejM (alkaline phosphatase superfamily)
VKKTQRILYRWAGWFFFVNTMIGALVVFNYANVMPDFSQITGATSSLIWFGRAYFGLAFLTQCALLMFAGCLISVLAVALYPRRWLVFPLAILLATIVLFGLAGDSITYNLYRFHYASVGWAVYKAGALSEIIVLGMPEKLLMLGVTLGAMLVELVAGLIVWQVIIRKQGKRLGYIFSGAIVGCVVVSYAMMTVATHSSSFLLSLNARNAVLRAARVAPYYSELYQLLIPGNYAVRKVKLPVGEKTFQTKGINKPLHYPLHTLQCTPSKQPLNIVIIALDTWRYDAMSQKITPHIFQFKKENIQFSHHLSGGNCTRPGVFSLFYGLPATYWDAFLAQQHSPVFIDQLQRRNYQLGLFASAPLNFPAFNNTVFAGVRPLPPRTHGGSSVARDKQITKNFHAFLKARDLHRPFFTFLFYDAIHNYCESVTPESKPFQPAVTQCDRFGLTVDSLREPYWNRYLNAAHFVDDQVGRVLADLKRQNLLENTVVIITADHGEQLNDQKMGYWVHASAYTKYQLHIPMIIHWPGMRAREVDYLTTHDDIVPTLMKKVLGCSNPIQDYSIGQSLFKSGHRPFLVAGSYGDYAIVMPEKVMRIYPNGDYSFNQLNGHLVKNKQGLMHTNLQEVYKMLNEYYK